MLPYCLPGERCCDLCISVGPAFGVKGSMKADPHKVTEDTDVLSHTDRKWNQYKQSPTEKHQPC